MAIVLIIVGGVLVVPVIIVVALLSFIFNVKNTVKDSVKNYADEIISDYESGYRVIDEGTVGDTLEIDGLEITLNEVKKYSFIGNQVYSNEPDEGNEYLVFFFDVKNNSDEEKNISYFDFSGMYEGDKKFPQFFLGEIDEVKILSETLFSGQTTSGYIAFEVESNWDYFEVYYRKLLEDSEIIFSVTNDDVL